jgi:hypothetical protein
VADDHHHRDHRRLHRADPRRGELRTPASPR